MKKNAENAHIIVSVSSNETLDSSNETLDSGFIVEIEIECFNLLPRSDLLNSAVDVV